jgi:hypothetical protein
MSMCVFTQDWSLIKKYNLFCMFNLSPFSFFYINLLSRYNFYQSWLHKMYKCHLIVLSFYIDRPFYSFFVSSVWCPKARHTFTQLSPSTMSIINDRRILLAFPLVLLLTDKLSERWSHLNGLMKYEQSFQNKSK